VGIDGSKALRKAVIDVCEHPVIQRCQIHKIRTSKNICRNDFGPLQVAG
jgi:transposase-like protein